MPEQETLLSPSNIWLFGREVVDLEIKQTDKAGSPDPETHNPFIGDRISCNNFLQKQMLCEGLEDAKKPRFARIYGIGYEGIYYDLPWPALFLVHGPGADAESHPGAARVSRAPDNSSRSGLATQDFSFADDLKVWGYDRADLSMRLDVDSGSFEQILLDVFLGGGGPGVSGARVSGARVAGARVAGARVAGARVAGARTRGGRDGED